MTVVCSNSPQIAVMVISRCCFSDDGMEFYWSACRTCSTLICPRLNRLRFFIQGVVVDVIDAKTSRLIQTGRGATHFAWQSCLLIMYQATKRGSRELKQPRRRRQQESQKFAYLTVKNNNFTRFARAFFSFARAFFSFAHLVDVLVLFTTWNDLFCGRVDDVTIW